MMLNTTSWNLLTDLWQEVWKKKRKKQAVVCVCVWACLCGLYEDTNLYNDMGMT